LPNVFDIDAQRALGYEFTAGAGDDVDAPGTVRLRLLPEAPLCVSDRAWAYAQSFAGGGSMTSYAVVTFCDSGAAADASVVLHELGHTFGLWHSSHPRDVMYPGTTGPDASSMSTRERTIMHLMFQRPAGNRFPDDDRQVLGITVRAARATTIVCR
jgi:hypothetical protein